jgi:hypothetical protein
MADFINFSHSIELDAKFLQQQKKDGSQDRCDV